MKNVRKLFEFGFYLIQKCVDCADLQEKLNDARKQIQKLQEELSASIKRNETHLANNCSLLMTARAEIQRKDSRIKDIQKE